MTGFYDWLYMTALWQNRDLAEKLLEFRGFSDIVFNPKKSINCQAHSAALFVSLYQSGEIESMIENIDDYMSIITNNRFQPYPVTQKVKQLDLPI